ncbi:MAG: hypothetical protein ACOX7Q_08745 [Kiritimatiellia bacterium]
MEVPRQLRAQLDKAFWREVKKLGIDHVIVTDHETLWRDRGESFTCRTDAAPGKGGDAGAEDYSRFMREELGYVYGPYNNFTDFSPMNAIWSRDLIARQRDGSFYPACSDATVRNPLLHRCSASVSLRTQTQVRL